MKKEVAFHHISVEESLKELESSLTGLTAEQAEQKLSKHGLNKLPTVAPPGALAIFFAQLKSPIIYLLLAASGTSFFFRDFTEGIAILLVIVINAIIGFIMEYQAVSSMDALRKLDFTQSKVYRNGSLTNINAEQIVPGDMIFVEGGDIIPADARLVDTVDLQIDESPLTGESQPVEKSMDTLPLKTSEVDRTNILYKGTAVTSGNGKAVVIATGPHTELGKIAQMAHTAEPEETPLDKRLEQFSKRLIWLVLAIAFPFLVVGIWQQRDMHLMVETAIALAVAAIPEGLPIVSTIALARGMLNLAKKHVLIKKLTAVETLGSADMVLTDKTGTLTENKLTLHKIQFTDEQEYVTHWHPRQLGLELKSERPDKPVPGGLEKLTEIAVLCNNASFKPGDHHEVGDPLEISLLKFAAALDREHYQRLKLSKHKVDEIPFNSVTKMMGTLHKNQETGEYSVSAKGAVESMLHSCSHLLHNNQEVPLTQDFRETLIHRSEKIAAQGMKVLAYGYKNTQKIEADFINDLVFVAITGFLDPPRADVKESLAECKNAGIKVVMITGDHYETAKEICKQVGLATADHQIPGMRGSKLAEIDLSDQKTSELVQKAVFFSRVTPKQKLELVNFYQRNGHVVGMTGDGINDAPALKKAEIGIAMGIRGTQVAREAADMILKDDAFPSLVVAIRQGRTIYNNIKNFIIYLLSCNLSEILIVAVAAFSNFALPLLPLQILFLNLVTDVFPALALGMSKGGSNIMQQPPRQMNQPLITKNNWYSIIAYSATITLTIFAAFVYSLNIKHYSANLANTMVFLSLSLAQLLHPLSLVDRSVSIFNNEIVRNIHIWLAVLFCITLIIAVYSIPVLNDILSLGQLTREHWVIVIVTGVVPVFVIRALKRLQIVD